MSCLHEGHFDLIETFVPDSSILISGLSCLEAWQILNNNNKCDKNATYFGSVRRFVPTSDNL